MNDPEIIERVRAANPDILLVCFGCPKQEKWISRHHRELGVPVTIGAGATIDFLAGRMARAPVWMRRSGTEWLFRLAQEPRRLARRYADDLLHFFPAIALQRWRQRRAVPKSRRKGQP
jgi:exopolysaccharide biosynthesis WecB/TagA/CpsF family protein